MTIEVMDKQLKIQAISDALEALEAGGHYGCCTVIRDACEVLIPVYDLDFEDKVTGLISEFRLFVACNDDITTTVSKAKLLSRAATSLFWWHVEDRKSRIDAIRSFLKHLESQGGSDEQ